MTRRSIICLLGVCALLLGACQKSPSFSFQEVEQDLTERRTKMREFLIEEPKLKSEFEKLSALYMQSHETKPDFSKLSIDDSEGRFGIGFPYLLEQDLYSAEQIKKLDTYESEIDSMREHLPKVLELEAKIKFLEERLKADTANEH